MVVGEILKNKHFQIIINMNVQKESRPKIGIPLWVIGSGAGIGISYYAYFAEYLEYEVIILPPTHSIREDLDLLVLPGGADVITTRYNTAPLVTQGNSDPFKEYFDTYWLPEYIKQGTPIFGICRGFQSLNVYFGGNLREVYHNTNSSVEPGKEMHKVWGAGFFTQEQREKIMSLNLPSSFGVNSRHHQGLKIKDLGHGLVPLYLDSSKNTAMACVEAFAHSSLPIVGVQWHPEDLYDSFSYLIIDYLINSKKSIFQ